MLIDLDPLQYVIYHYCKLSCHTEFLVSKIKLKCYKTCFSECFQKFKQISYGQADCRGWVGVTVGQEAVELIRKNAPKEAITL